VKLTLLSLSQFARANFEDGSKQKSRIDVMEPVIEGRQSTKYRLGQFGLTRVLLLRDRRRAFAFDSFCGDREPAVALVLQLDYSGRYEVCCGSTRHAHSRRHNTTARRCRRPGAEDFLYYFIEASHLLTLDKIRSRLAPSRDVPMRSA
jgi:hypothetical protein